MRWVLVATATCLGLFLSSLYLALYECVFGTPAALLIPNAVFRFYNLNYYALPWVGAMFCICSGLSALAFSGGIPKLAVWASGGSAGAAWVLMRAAHLVPYPLTRLGGDPSFPEYLLYGCGLVCIHLFAGWSVARATRVLWREQLSPEGRATKASSHRYDLGFTLTELLVVISILALLSALMFSVVARAKRNARYAEDLSSLRQSYTAVCLYENDSDGGSPPSLLDLVPRYEPFETLQSRLDVRLGEKRQEWRLTFGSPAHR